MTPERLAELERVLTQLEEEEERRRVWAATELKKLERLRAAQKKAKARAEAESPPTPVVRKKGGWVFVNRSKLARPGAA